MATKRTKATGKAKTAKVKASPLLAYALKHVEALLAIPSATNRVGAVADHVEAYARKAGLSVERDPDDTLRMRYKGSDRTRVVGYGAHLDRIGLMVDAVMDDGTVQVSAIGGLYPGHVMDGVVASIQVGKEREARMLEGVITHLDTPIHKVGREGFQKREHKWEKLRLRPDVCIGCTKKDGKAKLQELGVKVGQLVWLDPMLKIDRGHGTMRGRWLDNTLGCATLLALIDHWKATKAKLAFDVDLLFSVAEEAGMGGTAVIRDGLTDFVAVDTSIGEDAENLANCAIKQKAGAFPYSERLTDELEAAADAVKAGFERRTFSGGGTDAEQARSAGFKGRLGCIVVPIYGLHSIEAATTQALDNMCLTLDAHARGLGGKAAKPAKRK